MQSSGAGDRGHGEKSPGASRVTSPRLGGVCADRWGVSMLPTKGRPGRGWGVPSVSVWDLGELLEVSCVRVVGWLS